MTTVLLVIHVIITVALVISILMQKSGADGLAGMGGGGGGNNFMTGRGAANMLTKTTAILATIFIVNSLFLAVVTSRGERESSIVDKIIGQNIEPKLQAEEIIEEISDEPALPFAE